MGAYQCRLAVGVGAFLHLRGHDSLRVRGHHRLPPVTVHGYVRPVLTTHSLEALVHVAECLCIRIERHIVARVFLENDQVRADIRSCFVAEHAVGQTESSHKTGILSQFLADGIVRRRIHESSGGDERHKTTLTYLVEGFQEEVVVDGRDGIAFRIVATLAVFIIHHLDVAEGNIRGRNIKCPLQLRPDGLKTVYCNTVVRIQSLQDATSKQVFLKGTDPHIGILALEGIAEFADTCRGVEHRSHLHA